MDMEMEHEDHLVAAAHHLLGVATLLLCLLAEHFIFVFQRHAALYLVPACAMLLVCRFCRRAATADTYLVDFACLKPPRRLRVPIPGLLEHLRLVGCFDDGSLEFMSRVIEGRGMGNETYFPPSLHIIPPSATHADAVQEAGALFFPTLDELFAKTGVPPSALGALVVNCSGFCPAPSLTAAIVNHYRMRGDVKTFNLSGMGCAAGVIAVDVARVVLRTHAVEHSVVVSAEVLTVGWYSGKDPLKLLLNSVFRTGCAAALLSNTDAAAAAPPAKYRLVTLKRSNLQADDRCYTSGMREEDDEGITGFNIARGFGGVARDLLRAHLPALAASILPWREKLSYAGSLLLYRLRRDRRDRRDRRHRQSERQQRRRPDHQDPIKPKFLTAARHFCLPSSGKPVIRKLVEGLGLGEEEAEAELVAYHRFGNQSSASLWYQLAYHETKGRVRRGDRVWQLFMGSGAKANSAVWERVRVVETTTVPRRRRQGTGAAGPTSSTTSRRRRRLSNLHRSIDQFIMHACLRSVQLGFLAAVRFFAFFFHVTRTYSCMGVECTSWCVCEACMRTEKC